MDSQSFVTHLSQSVDALDDVAYHRRICSGQTALKLQILQELQQTVGTVTTAVNQTCMGQRNREEHSPLSVTYLEPAPNSASRTVSLVSGSRVRCRRRVDDCVSSEVGKLCDRSQQTTGIYKKTKIKTKLGAIGTQTI